MDIADFDFSLPDTHIALRPLNKRDAARLLVIHEDGRLEDSTISDLPNLLGSLDHLLLNDTRVIPARLDGRLVACGRGVSLTLTRREADIADALAQPAKRLGIGARIAFGDALEASVLAREGGKVTMRFNKAGAELEEALLAAGQMPLPPYIARRRAPDAQDVEDYQTIYARAPGAIAAPTAGLHITDALLRALKEKDIHTSMATLHVGPGTFIPVRTENPAEHTMHPEAGVLSAETAENLNRTREKGGRCVAVGTTSLRLMETATDETGHVAPFDGETSLFILPGYRFKAVDVLLTNFHLPRSTLFMLVCAFAGVKRMQEAYAHAIAHAYRFYSYGDACLIFRPKVRT